MPKGVNKTGGGKMKPTPPSPGAADSAAGVGVAAGATSSVDPGPPATQAARQTGDGAAPATIIIGQADVVGAPAAAPVSPPAAAAGDAPPAVAAQLVASSVQPAVVDQVAGIAAAAIGITATGDIAGSEVSPVGRADAPPAAPEFAPGAADQVLPAGGFVPPSVQLAADTLDPRLEWLKPTILGFEISAVRDGFRRAGRAWTREPEFVSVDDITEEQIQLLRADPSIRIFPAQRPAPSEDGAQ